MFDLLVLRLRNDGNFAGKQKGANNDENPKENKAVGSVLLAKAGGNQTKGNMSDAGNQLNIKKAVEFFIKMKPFLFRSRVLFSHLSWRLVMDYLHADSNTGSGSGNAKPSNPGDTLAGKSESTPNFFALLNFPA